MPEPTIRRPSTALAGLLRLIRGALAPAGTRRPGGRAEARVVFRHYL